MTNVNDRSETSGGEKRKARAGRFGIDHASTNAIRLSLQTLSESKRSADITSTRSADVSRNEPPDGTIGEETAIDAEGQLPRRISPERY